MIPAWAPAGRCPFRVDLMVIPNIERIESPALHRSETEVLFVLPADYAGVGGGDHINSAGSTTANQVPVHSVLVNVQTKAVHISFAGGGKIASVAASSAAMSLSISSRLEI